MQIERNQKKKCRYTYDFDLHNFDHLFNRIRLHKLNFALFFQQNSFEYRKRINQGCMQIRTLATLWKMRGEKNWRAKGVRDGYKSKLKAGREESENRVV